MKKFTVSIAGATAAVLLALTACGGSDSSAGAGSASVGGAAAATASGDATGNLTYWMWVSDQLPGYKACADAFHTANPGITVDVQQYGWDDYWQKLNSSLGAGSGPDVFADHLSKYPEFVNKGQILSISDALTADKFDTGIYQQGLLDLWTAQDGKIYGLPKDFDTIAVFYNTDLTTQAGVTANLEWNPTDGGTYEKAIAHLTVDANGVRGDEPGFDKTNVKVYGLGTENPDYTGQSTWSMYPASNGWSATDKNPWGTQYNYNDPKFQESMAWWHSLMDKGYMPTLDKLIGVDASQQLGAGNYAMLTGGSWSIKPYTSLGGVKVGIAPIPVGPTGKRASMYNGIADSINAETKNQAAAVKWVEFTGSAACQNLVADQAVVFPAIPEATDRAVAAFQAKGLDISPFTDRLKDKETFLFPITDHAADIGAIMNPALQSYLSGASDVNAFNDANTQVNDLFK